MLNFPLMSDVLVSREGFEKLQRELTELKTVERVRIADVIREARSHGDLRENAMYHEAKLNQKRLEGRIADLEKMLQIAKIIERDGDSDSAQLSSRVTLRDLEFADDLTITLVGSYEADPANDRISVTSPLGSACYGRKVGDEFEVEAPAGVTKYRVLAVDQPD